LQLLVNSIQGSATGNIITASVDERNMTGLKRSLESVYKDVDFVWSISSTKADAVLADNVEGKGELKAQFKGLNYSTIYYVDLKVTANDNGKEISASATSKNIPTEALTPTDIENGLISLTFNNNVTGNTLKSSVINDDNFVKFKALFPKADYKWKLQDNSNNSIINISDTIDATNVKEWQSLHYNRSYTPWIVVKVNGEEAQWGETASIGGITQKSLQDDLNKLNIFANVPSGKTNEITAGIRQNEQFKTFKALYPNAKYEWSIDSNLNNTDVVGEDAKWTGLAYDTDHKAKLTVTFTDTDGTNISAENTAETKTLKYTPQNLQDDLAAANIIATPTANTIEARLVNLMRFKALYPNAEYEWSIDSNLNNTDVVGEDAKWTGLKYSVKYNVQLIVESDNIVARVTTDATTNNINQVSLEDEVKKLQVSANPLGNSIEANMENNENFKHFKKMFPLAGYKWILKNKTTNTDLYTTNTDKDNVTNIKKWNGLSWDESFTVTIEVSVNRFKVRFGESVNTPTNTNSVSIILPKYGDELTEIGLTANAHLSQGVTVLKYKWYVDNVLVGTTKDGKYTIKLPAYVNPKSDNISVGVTIEDSAGNTTTSNTYDVKIHAMLLSQPVISDTIEGNITVTKDGKLAQSGSKIKLNIEAQNLEAGKVKEYNWYVNGTKLTDKGAILNYTLPSYDKNNRIFRFTAEAVNKQNITTVPSKPRIIASTSDKHLTQVKYEFNANAIDMLNQFQNEIYDEVIDTFNLEKNHRVTHAKLSDLGSNRISIKCDTGYYIIYPTGDRIKNYRGIRVTWDFKTGNVISTQNVDMGDSQFFASSPNQNITTASWELTCQPDPNPIIW
ncbi:hypothetical protein QIW57_08805, partial [Francisellaceae bacterium CB52]